MTALYFHSSFIIENIIKDMKILQKYELFIYINSLGCYHKLEL